MRDLDRWKDKVEISLDGRQIFFLFFGSAVAACLIFVVGVLIGKRIEARALAMQPAPIEDPLAALDQLGDADEADEGLTFHKALAARGDKPEKADNKADKAVEPAKPVKVADKSDKTSPKLDGKVADKNDKSDKADKVALTAMTDDDLDARPEAAPSKPEAVAAKDKDGKVDGDAGVTKKKPDAKSTVAQKPLPPTKAQVVQATPAKKPDANKKPDAAQSHFTLQLSAFPDKSDAEEFMHKIQTAGYKPFLVASEIPGKGVFFRVRVGDYASRQSAVDAKAEFERKQRIIAY
ncbi:MAG TPA: SPOR domain-containing protein, partial [Polyangia bacterium]|nr:SPOR domain-containing protein [Polyangia bacterium]